MTRRTLWLSGLILVALIGLGLGAGFSAWVYRPAAALQLTAPGLAEFVKFLMEKRLGLLPIDRLHFLAPLAVAGLGTPLLAVNQSLSWPTWLRWGLRLWTLPLALAILSPVWSPGVLLSAEFRLQTVIAGLAVLLAVIAPVGGRLPLKWLLSITAIAALAASGLALNQFRLVQTALGSTYADTINLGWGGWLTIASAIGLAIAAILAWFIKNPPTPNR